MESARRGRKGGGPGDTFLNSCVDCVRRWRAGGSV